MDLPMLTLSVLDRWAPGVASVLMKEREQSRLAHGHFRVKLSR